MKIPFKILLVAQILLFFQPWEYPFRKEKGDGKEEYESKRDCYKNEQEVHMRFFL